MIAHVRNQPYQSKKAIGSNLTRREFVATSIATAASSMLLGRSNPAMASQTATPVYAIRQNGDMLFYKHTGVDDGSADWPVQADQIGNGWDFREVFAGDNGAVYAIRQNGDMLFYKHTGFNDGSPKADSGSAIGNGWNFRQVFAGDNGAVYAIRQNGDMLFYQHAGYNDGSAYWPIQAQPIGNGWDFRQVFAGPQGSVYAIRENGDMLFYKHAAITTARQTGPFRPSRSATAGIFGRSLPAAKLKLALSLPCCLARS